MGNKTGSKKEEVNQCQEPCEDCPYVLTEDHCRVCKYNRGWR